MPILEINGRRVEIGDGFLSLSPEEQAAEVDEIAASLSGPGSALEPGQGPGTGFAPREARETIEPETPELRREIDRSKNVAGYNALPWYKKEARDLTDAITLFGTGATVGFSDRLAALVSGKTLEEEQAITQAARDRQGWAGTALEVGGAVASIPRMGLGFAHGLMKAAPAVTRTGKAARTVGTGAALAGEGAAFGTLGAVGYGTDVGTGAGIGSVAGPVGQAVGSAVRGTARALGPKAPLESLEAIEAAKQAAYARSEAQGVRVKPGWLINLKNEIKESLDDWGYLPEGTTNVPNAFMNVLDRFAAEGKTRLKDVDNLRKMAGRLRESDDATERALGHQITKKVDKHLDRINLTNLEIGGNKTEALSALKEGRRLHATEIKVETVEEAIKRAERMAEGGNQTLPKALATQFRGILNNKGRRRGFSTEELAAMEEIARNAGKVSTKALGVLTALSPTNKLNMIAQVAAGGATLGSSLPVQAGLLATGYGAQKVGERLAKNNVYALARLIRQNGLTPELASQVRKLPRARQERLGRVLTGWGINEVVAE
jgi:hypothetical protein